MNSLEPLPDSELSLLLTHEQSLRVRQQELEEQYSGLRDLDLWLQLISVRLRIAVTLLERYQGGVRQSTPANPGASPAQRELIRVKGLAAMDGLDELRRLNVSHEQRPVLTDMPAYRDITALLERFVAMGGGALLDRREHNERRNRAVVRALVESLGKFVAPDDSHEQTFKTEGLPRLLRRLVKLFLPVLARENQQEPPYGIEEGHEVLLRSERMKMPLSQAVYYLESELLPHLRAQLEQDPGNRLLQRRERVVQERLREYKGIRWTPRATPINLERGFYTDWLSHYTADGELLVTVELPVQFLSGTNLDRLQEQVRNEVVRRLAGRGVCPELDAEYRFRKSLESGRRGSSRVPSAKLDFLKGFELLKEDFPLLRRLEDRKDLQQLVDLLRREGAGRTRRLLEDQTPPAFADRLPGPGLDGPDR